MCRWYRIVGAITLILLIGMSVRLFLMDSFIRNELTVHIHETSNLLNYLMSHVPREPPNHTNIASGAF